ncbi:hypothetical protein JCM3765_004152 [Sporobolomyces pararoseus]
MSSTPIDPATPPEPLVSPPRVPPYSLPSLSPALQDRISSLTPFRFHTPFPSNPTFIEPFIPLSPVSSSATEPLELILTPPRPDDLSVQVKCLNDPSVGLRLIGPPYPYTFEMGQEWSGFRYENVQTYFERLYKYYSDDKEQKGELEEKETRREGIPFASIRNWKTGEWVGEIGICRWEFKDIENEAERQKMYKENEEREIGQDELVWSFGCEL